MGPWKFHFSTKEDYYDTLQPMGVLMQQHLQSLAEYPPVQGASFDMSNVVEQFINNPRP